MPAPILKTKESRLPGENGKPVIHPRQEEFDTEPVRLADAWLGFLFVVSLLTVSVTGVLVAWPVLTWVASRFTEI